MSDTRLRSTEQGDEIDATIVRDFIRAGLEHDAVADSVHELLYEHVVAGRYHPTVVAASLRPMLVELLDAANESDWRQIADVLIAEARATLESEPARPGDDRRVRRWRRRRSP